MSYSQTKLSFLCDMAKVFKGQIFVGKTTSKCEITKDNNEKTGDSPF
jgi:hypothetical protein